MKVQNWKYEFPISDSFKLELPAGAVFLSAQIQQAKPVMWFTVNPDLKKEIRMFRVVGTGHEFDLRITDRHLGTFQYGDYVGHLYEV